MKQIADKLDCSPRAIQYWMDRHGLKRRSISDAVYRKQNPEGDPFNVIKPGTSMEFLLFGLGLGLYWGEGTKANRHSIRLGNTDPALIKSFMLFLEKIYRVDRNKIRFSLQVFTDIDVDEALNYWTRTLRVKKSQFSKTTVTISGKVGNYRKKSKYGVLTVHFNNKKSRDILNQQLAEIAQLVEHVNGNDEVTGSNPVLGSMPP